jgi:dTDP-4-amino-4,6-dideoxygalactose transaminase
VARFTPEWTPSTLAVPFNKPTLAGDELRYVAEAVDAGHTAGDGLFTQKCQALLEQVLSTHRVLLTTSCTHALEMAALLLDIEPGDEVIVPSFTFVSTANAFVLRGARPVFADIRPDTLNLDETRLSDLLTGRTKAVLPVHYAGVACAMDPILDIARRHGVAVVEDNAQGLFGRYRGRYLGTVGCLATQSFHETKNISCGEGGALVINDPAYADRAEILREKGTDRKRFLRGEVDKYTWVDRGSSYLPSDILAAFLYAQLLARDRIQAKRRFVWEYYFAHLEPWAHDQGVGLPHVPAECEQTYHMFYLLLPCADDRQRFVRHLRARGIRSVFHYVPLHLSEMGRRLGGKPGDCPVTEDISARLVRLPFYNALTESELAHVVAAVCDFRGAGRLS